MLQWNIESSSVRTKMYLMTALSIAGAILPSLDREVAIRLGFGWAEESLFLPRTSISCLLLLKVATRPRISLIRRLETARQILFLPLLALPPPLRIIRSSTQSSDPILSSLFWLRLAIVTCSRNEVWFSGDTESNDTLSAVVNLQIGKFQHPKTSQPSRQWRLLLRGCN
jgi:hypothetical protein